eukprot:Hpha_TRINITY_DN10719_c0_g1::TRINITY_DN10719_c0_g1_i1::g.43439::m.43439
MAALSRELTGACKLCLKASIVFLMTGLLTGVWKYRQMMRSESGRAGHYVDVAHRASLMYSNASLLLAVCGQLSVFSSQTNIKAARATLSYFAMAIVTYIVHGIQNDTTNQIQQTKTQAPGAVPLWLLKLFMNTLVLAEVGGSGILGLGAWKFLEQ